MDYYKTVGEQFAGYFQSEYDGSYGTVESDIARRDFGRLTENYLIWAQVHGNFKDAAKRALFKPYPHWIELYECCRDSVREHAALETEYLGGVTCAKIMRDAMTILRERHGLNVPRWWLPVMDSLRGKDQQSPKRKSIGHCELKDGRVLFYPGR